ncbi:hypothetical protein [Methylobacterium sp. Leaf466]|nr:hypothetical protein [Methylobacterium sp. Leaf466]
MRLGRKRDEPAGDGRERDDEAWKDRLIALGLCLGAGLTLVWCAVIAGSTWWLVERMGF